MIIILKDTIGYWIYCIVKKTQHSNNYRAFRTKDPVQSGKHSRIEISQNFINCSRKQRQMEQEEKQTTRQTKPRNVCNVNHKHKRRTRSCLTERERVNCQNQKTSALVPAIFFLTTTLTKFPCLRRKFLKMMSWSLLMARNVSPHPYHEPLRNWN